jgi:septal ring factor EnvC (AmiA/AmiB activator)
MPSHRPNVSAGKSAVPPVDPVFRAEMERQLLEIQDAFAAFVDDAERQRLEAEARLREAEQQKNDAENRMRTIERQKQDAEDQLREAAGQLRKLQKTRAVRIVRFFRRLNPLGSERKRIR